MKNNDTPLVKMIPVNQIDVINPRGRGQKKHQLIINNIAKIGLKKPITVSEKKQQGEKKYNLVCGQGRLEAFIQQEQDLVPAIVINASEQDCLLMSLIENLARKKSTGL